MHAIRPMVVGIAFVLTVTTGALAGQTQQTAPPPPKPTPQASPKPDQPTQEPATRKPSSCRRRKPSSS